MALKDVTDAKAVERALDEFRRLGREAFLEKYGFGRSRSYFLVQNGERHDSKAVLGAAHGYQFPDVGPLRPSEFSGGDHATAMALRRMGFRVEQSAGDTGSEMSPSRSKHEGQAFLYYWRDFLADMSGREPIYTFLQSSRRMLDIRPGDIVWTVARPSKGHYIVAARFEVEATGANRRGSAAVRRGAYYFRSPNSGAVFFNPNSQPNAEDLIRSLGLPTNAEFLGQSFQGGAGVAHLSAEAAQLILGHSEHLALDASLTTPKAAARWHSSRVDAQLSDLALASGFSETKVAERREYDRELFVRNQTHVRKLKELYGGVCQITGKQVAGGIAGDLTEVHHIEWLTRGGSDTPDNMLVVSPDIHTAIHAANGMLIWNKHEPILCIGEVKLPLAVNKHLTPPI